jgi:outer membrane usher protein FimD/PapC
VPFLTRKGQVRYKLAVANPRRRLACVEDNAFMSGEFLGDTSNSLYGGTLADGDRYRPIAAGIGQNMALSGALSFDVTQATSQLPNKPSQTGYSYRFNYSKRFDTTEASLRWPAIAYSTRSSSATPASWTARIMTASRKTDAQRHGQPVHSRAVTQSLCEPAPTNLVGRRSSNTGSLTAGYNFDLGRWKNLGVSASFSKPTMKIERTTISSTCL